MLATVYRIAFYLFLIWAPLPLGSNRPVFWAINGVACLSIFTLLVIAELRGEQGRSTPRRMVAGLLLMTAPLLGWMLVQAVSFTPGFLHAAEWQMLAADGIAGGGAISINPSATYMAASCFVTLALAGIIAARIASSPRRAATLITVALVSTGIVALWGFIALALDLPQHLLSTEGGDGLTSVFVNRNTTATYIGFGLIIAVALLARRLETSAGAPGLAAAIFDFPRRVGLHLLLVLFFAVALLATASRAGVLAGLFAALLVFLLGSRRAPGSARWVVGGVMAAIGLAFIFLGETSSTFFARLASTDLEGDARWQLYRDTLDAILARPITGFGAGTFADLFPAFHGPELGRTGVWLEAHNTYLETAAELGLPATFAILGGLLVLVLRLLRTAWQGDDPVPASVIAAGAAILVGIHSLFDFSVQVQAVGLMFAVLLGAGIAARARLSLRQTPVATDTPSTPRRYETFNVVPGATHPQA